MMLIGVAVQLVVSRGRRSIATTESVSEGAIEMGGTEGS
jgi:hypothetical protein